MRPTGWTAAFASEFAEQSTSLFAGCATITHRAAVAIAAVALATGVVVKTAGRASQ